MDLNRRNGWVLVSEKPDRWINLDSARGLDVSSDGSSKLWWTANNNPALLNAQETASLLAVIDPYYLTGRQLEIPTLLASEPSPPSPLSPGGEGELEGRLRRPRRRAG